MHKVTWFEDGPISALKLASFEETSRMPCRCSSFFITMANPNLAPCKELLVTKTHVKCSHIANKMSARYNVLHGWLLSSRKTSHLSTIALKASFFDAVATGCGVAFTIETAFYWSPFRATVAQVLFVGGNRTARIIMLLASRAHMG